MKNAIVIGAHYGDEGKGQTVAALAATGDFAWVVRFNGGHQVSHTARKGDINHTFSNFGAGTLEGIPTYWSQFCTVHPTGFMNEVHDLKIKDVRPIIYIDPNCPITTPYDIVANQQNAKNGHGTVGVGFGATIEREVEGCSFLAKDLILGINHITAKIFEVGQHYGFPENLPESIDSFTLNCCFTTNHAKVQAAPITSNQGVIFEGAQGLHLDQDFGVFPHVTRSNTTTKNAITLITKLKREKLDNEVIYVTRPYVTRHGNGSLLREGAFTPPKNCDEANVSSVWQGDLRYAPIDLTEMERGISYDIAMGNFPAKRRIAVTCLHHVDDYITISNGWKLEVISKGSLESLLNKAILKNF